MKRLPLLPILALAFLLLNGCGGGSIPIDVPVGSDSGACGVDTYIPNYVQELQVPAGSPTGLDALTHWLAFPINVYFVQDANWSQARQDVAEQGFNLWTAAVPQVTYNVVSSQNQADVVVTFVTPDEIPGALGETNVSYDPNTLEIFSATMELTIGDSSYGFDQQLSTSGHEFGHALGIGGHSPNANDIMNAVNTVDQVSEEDVNTLYTAYCGNFNQVGAQSARHRPKTLVTKTLTKPKPR